MHSESPSWFVLSQNATANLGLTALLPALILTIFALLVMLLRWYSKIRLMPGTWHFEDVLFTLALLLSVGMTAVIGAEYRVDMAPTNDIDLPLPNLPYMLKLVFAQCLIYQIAINVVKTAFMHQYLRLFSHLRYPRYYCYVLLVLIIGAAAWAVFGLVFLCRPIQAYWDVKIDGHCMDAEDHFWSTSIIGIVLDWAIWILPMPVVGSLRLPKRQKWGLWGLFGLGCLACVVSILRLTLVNEAVHEGKATKSGTYAVVLSSVELNVAIICASLAVLKPLYAKWIPALVSEQPPSASEDTQMLRRLTRVALLNGDLLEEDKAAQPARVRRDTAVAGLSWSGGLSSQDNEIPGRLERPRSPVPNTSKHESSLV